MSVSIEIAKILGPTLGVVGLGVLVNRAGFYAMAKEFIASPALIFIAGLLAFLPGIAIVASHNIWHGWPMIITIFGWVCVFAGVMRILLGQKLVPLGSAMLEKTWVLPVSSLIYLALGAYLSYQGWCPQSALGG